VDRCLHVRGVLTIQNLNSEVLLCKKIIIGMSTMVLRGTIQKLNQGWFFYWISTQIIYRLLNGTLIQYIPTQTTHQSWNHFCDVLGSFAIWDSSVTIVHLPHGFTPTNTCLGYVTLECHATSQIIWELFAHKGRQTIC
jgi:hypothetical protein